MDYVRVITLTGHRSKILELLIFINILFGEWDFQWLTIPLFISLWDGIYRVIRGAIGREEEQLFVDGGIVLGPRDFTSLLASTFTPSRCIVIENSQIFVLIMVT